MEKIAVRQLSQGSDQKSHERDYLVRHVHASSATFMQCARYGVLGFRQTTKEFEYSYRDWYISGQSAVEIPSLAQLLRP